MFLGDKAFDANKVREFLARNGAEAVIPARKGTKGAAAMTERNINGDI